MQYSIQKHEKYPHFLQITLTFKASNSSEILKLPLWRPGRYQVQNFAKNIREMSVNKGSIKVIGRNTWLLSEINDGDTIQLTYNYYARHQDAGGTWLNEDFCLINFIGCAVVPELKLHTKGTVSLHFESDFKIATSLNKEGEVWVYKNFEELTESPILLGKSLHHHTFSYEGCKHHIWLQGKVNPDWNKIGNDFLAFTKVQLEIFKSFPHKDYHYLCILPSYKHYHGVEHHKNTVITLGPANEFLNTDFYNNLLGVSSHELFHVWNIKQIRPKELLPYDLFNESYFDTGYVAEGITTYYGDWCLYRAGVFDREQYRKELITLLDRHFENQGRFVKSVADSSLELWVDGYEKGIPARKTSIYVKGALVSLMLDAKIQKETNKEKSLDDVMLELYTSFGKTNKGYTSKDFQAIVESILGYKMDDFFKNYIYGIVDLEEPLKEALEYFGWDIQKSNAKSRWMSDFGLKLNATGEVIDKAYNASFSIEVGDKIRAINGQKIESFEKVILGLDKFELLVEREGEFLLKQLSSKKNMYYSKLSIT